METAAAKRPASRRSQHQLTETWAIIILSVSALASSYASYQQGRWNGEQDAHFALATTAETAASKEETLAFQRESVNAMHFTQWLNAYANGDAVLEQFYRDRFRPSFRAAFDRWLATRPRYNPDAPPTPFDVPGYRKQSRLKADQLQGQSDRYLAAAKEDMRISDAYGQSVIILALALFLGGMVQAFDSHRRRLVLVGLAAITTAFGLSTLVPLPMLVPG